MGISMPKFVNDSCASVKRSYYSFKQGYEGLKETFHIAKSAYKIARSFDPTKFSEAKDPKEIINAINNSGANIPDQYKQMLKIIPEDTLKRLTNILYESIVKEHTHSDDGDSEEQQSSGHAHRQGPSQEDSFPDFSTNEGVSEAIGRMANAMAQKTNHNKRHIETSHSQQEYIDVDPPAQIHYKPEYSEMKSDDDRETSFNDNNIEIEAEDRGRINRPFGIRNNNFNFQQSLKNGEQFSEDQRDRLPHETSEDRSYFRQDTRDQSENLSYLNQSTEPQPQEVKKDLPPLTKQLGAELQKRYGPSWKQKLPGFVHHPEITENIPDLGLGLGKESNKDMVITMSRVLKDLM